MSSLAVFHTPQLCKFNCYIKFPSANLTHLLFSQNPAARCQSYFKHPWNSAKGFLRVHSFLEVLQDNFSVMAQDDANMP